METVSVAVTEAAVEETVAEYLHFGFRVVSVQKPDGEGAPPDEKALRLITLERDPAMPYYGNLKALFSEYSDKKREKNALLAPICAIKPRRRGISALFTKFRRPTDPQPPTDVAEDQRKQELVRIQEALSRIWKEAEKYL